MGKDFLAVTGSDTAQPTARCCSATLRDSSALCLTSTAVHSKRPLCMSAPLLPSSAHRPTGASCGAMCMSVAKNQHNVCVCFFRTGDSPFVRFVFSLASLCLLLHVGPCFLLSSYLVSACKKQGPPHGRVSLSFVVSPSLSRSPSLSSRDAPSRLLARWHAIAPPLPPHTRTLPTHFTVIPYRHTLPTHPTDTRTHAHTHVNAA